MSRLTFIKCDDGTWDFKNEEGIILGWLEKLRVGAWMHWCHFLNYGCYLSPGCADEVREFQRKLGSSKLTFKEVEKFQKDMINSFATKKEEKTEKATD